MKPIRLLLAAIALLAVASQATAQTIVVLASKYSHKVLTYDAGAATPVVLRDLTGANNQYWTLHYAGGGAYYLYAAASGMALTAPTNTPDTPIAIAPLNWGDVRQMWDFHTVAFTEKLLFNINTGLALSPTWRNYTTEGGAVLQVDVAQSDNNWLVVPLQWGPSSGSIVASTGHDESIVWVKQVRNAVRVIFHVWSEADPQGTSSWHEASLWAADDSWDFDRVRIPAHVGSPRTYKVDAYAQGADAQWAIVATANLVFPANPTAPLHPRRVVVLP